jgi:hypothetical protein
VLVLTDEIVELIDAYYMAGSRHGVDRLLYEAEQMEDADPKQAKRAEKIRTYAENKGL